MSSVCLVVEEPSSPLPFLRGNLPSALHEGIHITLGLPCLTQSPLDQLPNDSLFPTRFLFSPCHRYTKWHGSDFYTKGETTDYRIWSRPLTQQEIYKELVSVAPESKDLICFLPLNIIDGTKVLDLSEFRNHGTLDDDCQVTPIKCRWPPMLKIKEEMERELIDLIRENSQERINTSSEEEGSWGSGCEAEEDEPSSSGSDEEAKVL